MTDIPMNDRTALLPLGWKPFFQQQLDAILGYVETISQLDVSGIEPTAYPSPVFDRMRDDEPHESLPLAAVLQNAPDQAQNQIRVPKVVADA